MSKVGLWRISEGKPKKINESNIKFEIDLEEWIESDPDLLQNGLTIVGRQLYVQAGVIDLLALDPQGRWVIIELKKDLLRREVIAQVIDYASCIADMPADELESKINEYLVKHNTTIQNLLSARDALEALHPNERDIVLIVVGTGKEPGLERIISYLNQYDMSISLVSYEVFEVGNQEKILLRELTDPEFEERKPRIDRYASIADICQLADNNGMGSEFRSLLEKAQELGLYARPYKKSIMYTPHSNRSRCLFTVWAVPEHGKMWVCAIPKAFPEFYSVTTETVLDKLGNTDQKPMDRESITKFITALQELFEEIEEE